MGLTRPQHYQLITDTVSFDDPILELNKALTAANTTDIGFIFNRGSTGDNVAILWDVSDQEFMLVSTAIDGDGSGNIVHGGYMDLHVGELKTTTLAFPTADGTDGQVIVTDGLGVLSFTTIDTSTTWGDIGGTLANQTDLDDRLTPIETTQSTNTGNISTNSGDILTLQTNSLDGNSEIDGGVY